MLQELSPARVRRAAAATVRGCSLACYTFLQGLGRMRKQGAMRISSLRLPARRRHIGCCRRQRVAGSRGKQQLLSQPYLVRPSAATARPLLPTGSRSGRHPHTRLQTQPASHPSASGRRSSSTHCRQLIPLQMGCDLSAQASMLTQLPRQPWLTSSSGQTVWRCCWQQQQRVRGC